MKNKNQQLPANWPEGMPLPSLEKSEELARKAAEQLEKGMRSFNFFERGKNQPSLFLFLKFD